MKKLIAILSSVGMVGAVAPMAVSCTKDVAKEHNLDISYISENKQTFMVVKYTDKIKVSNKYKWSDYEVYQKTDYEKWSRDHPYINVSVRGTDGEFQGKGIPGIGSDVKVTLHNKDDESKFGQEKHSGDQKKIEVSVDVEFRLLINNKYSGLLYVDIVCTYGTAINEFTGTSWEINLPKSVNI